MTNLFSKSTLAIVSVVVLTIASILPGCGGSGTSIEKKTRIVNEAIGDEIRTFEMKPVSVVRGGQVTVHPSIERITDGSGKLLGYAVKERVVSRSGPFTILVVVGPDLCVKRAEVLEYRAVHGRKVRSPEFTKQFAGKCAGDAIKLDTDIHAISGATLSSRAMTDGVRKAIADIQSIKE